MTNSRPDPTLPVFKRPRRPDGMDPVPSTRPLVEFMNVILRNYKCLCSLRGCRDDLLRVGSLLQKVRSLFVGGPSKTSFPPKTRGIKEPYLNVVLLSII